MSSKFYRWPKTSRREYIEMIKAFLRAGRTEEETERQFLRFFSKSRVREYLEIARREIERELAREREEQQQKEGEQTP